MPQIYDILWSNFELFFQLQFITRRIESAVFTTTGIYVKVKQIPFHHLLIAVEVEITCNKIVCNNIVFAF